MKLERQTEKVSITDYCFDEVGQEHMVFKGIVISREICFLNFGRLPQPTTTVIELVIDTGNKIISLSMLNHGNVENFMRYLTQLNDRELLISEYMIEVTMDLITSMDDPYGSFKFKCVEPTYRQNFLRDEFKNGYLFL